MNLYESVERALSGAGSFSVVDPYSCGDGDWNAIYEPFRGKIVFWPFGSTRAEVMRFLTALRQGVVPVLISPAIPRLKYEALRKEYPNWGHLEDDGSIAGSNLSSPEERLLFIATTSGSSGSPKFIAATRGNIEANVAAVHKAQKLGEIRSTAVWLPFFFNYALINQLFWAVLFEKTLILLPGMKQPEASFGLMRETRAEMVCWVNSQARMIQKLGFDGRHALGDVKLVNFGGAPFPMHFFDYLGKIFPNAEFINNYGCTEALARLSMCRVTHPDQDVTFTGKPIDCVTLREREGRLEFTGSSKTLGEVRNDGSILRYGEWVPTGDMGRIQDGEIRVLGRYDQVFNASGERLSLVEIEGVLHKIPGVENACAWTFTPHQGEEEPAAVIQGESIPSAADVRHFCRLYLPSTAWPKKLFWTKHWPLTDRGKTDRQTIKTNAEQNQYDLLDFGFSVRAGDVHKP
jgi:D-alanine--poly(phosphoribitol) ligase subunit 1